MTSLKTWSSASTSKRVSINRLRPFVLLAAACLGGAGCASRPAAPRAAAAPLHGSVRLDALVRQHPGWDGVGRYDAAIQRLDRAVSGVPGTPPTPAVTLPPLPAGNAMAPPSAGGDSGTDAHLRSVQRDLLAGIRARRALARAEQSARQRSLWRREARQLFPVPAQSTDVVPDFNVQLLRLNVKTLTQTLENWQLSTPPTPRLNALRVKVEADRSRLLALIAAHDAAVQGRQNTYDAQVQSRREARLAYIEAQADALSARLEREDARTLAAQQALLSEERAALLTALARPMPPAVPAAGTLGAVTLPSAPGAARAALSASALRAARTRLQAQRTRWLRYLYDDTKAAAEDAAERRHWIITFGPAPPGQRDLTGPVAEALKSGPWHV